MIAFGDAHTRPPGLVPRGWRMGEDFRAAVAEANDGIPSGAIEVIDVETIGLVDPAFPARSLRDRYHSLSPKPGSYPEH